MTRRPLALVIALALGLAVAGCSDDGGGSDDGAATTTTEATADHDGAVEALRRQIGYLADGQTGRAYEEIHPAQQALFTADEYGACVGSVPDAELGDVKETYEENITIPGTDTEVDAVAITAEVTVGDQTDTDTYHEVEVNGEWVFTVTAAEDIAAGTC